MNAEEDKTHLKQRIARALDDYLSRGKRIEKLSPASAKPRRRAQNEQAPPGDTFWPELFDTPNPEVGHS